MVADLEMKERVMLDRTPVAAIKGVSADEVDCTSNVATVAPCHHEQNIVGHALADQGKELPVEVWPAPFAGGGFHVSGVGIITCRFCYGAGSAPVDHYAGSKRLTPFLAQCLALARRQRFEKILVGFIAFIEEMELLVLAQQKILCLKGGDVFFGGEGDMGGGYAQLVRKRFQAARQCAA